MNIEIPNQSLYFYILYMNLKVGKSKLYEWCKENNIPTNIKNNQSTKNTVGLYLYNPISAIAG